jgi:hypothetical protein
MLAAEVAQLGVRRLEAACVAIDGGDMGAGPGETRRDGPADAAASARHHANAACQAKPV